MKLSSDWKVTIDSILFSIIHDLALILRNKYVIGCLSELLFVLLREKIYPSSSIAFYVFDYIQLLCMYETHMRACDCAPCFTIATFGGLASRIVSETEGKKVNYHAGTFKVAENILRDLLAT